MKTGLKLISLIFCLGFFSLPVKSICPSGEVPCPIGDGVCAPSINQCPGVVKFQGKPGVYPLPEGTIFYCETGAKPSPSDSEEKKPEPPYSCSTNKSALPLFGATLSKYDFKPGIVYSFGDDIAFKCSSPPEKATIPSPPNGAAQEYWVCPKGSSHKK